MSLSGTDGVVIGALEPMLDMGRGGSSVNRVTRSPTEVHPPGSEFNAGAAMDGGKRDERSGVESTDSAGGLSCLRLHAKYSVYLWRSGTC